MKKTVYELLGMIKNDNVDYKYVKYFDRINEKDDIMLACKENIIYKLNNSNIELDDIVEILEEEKKIPENINLAYIDKEYLLEKEDVDRRINDIINRHNILVDKVIDYLDYLKSKGESND